MLRMELPWITFSTLLSIAVVAPSSAQPLSWKNTGNFDYAKHLAKTPSQGAGLPDMPPGFEASLAHPNNFNPVVSGLDFLSDGRMVLLHSSYMSRGAIIYLVENASGPRENIKFTKIAENLLAPFGVKVINDEIYYTAQDGIWKLVKTGSTPEKWEIKFLAKYIVPGMEAGASKGSRYPFFNIVLANGGLYFGNGAYKNFNPPGTNEGYAVRYDLATGEQEVISKGLRMPNGMGANAAGDVFYADNQGEYRPGSPIYHLGKGRHFGMAAVRGLEDNQGGHMKNMFPPPPADSITPPAVWVPFGDESRSLTNMHYLNHTGFQGQFLVGDNAKGVVHRIFLEKVKGEYQGASFQFSGILEAGIQSFATGPDGTIFGGALGQGAGHNWKGRKQGLMKWKPIGGPLQAIERVSSQSEGFDIVFTEPLAANAIKPENFWVHSYRYEPTSDYGGPAVDKRNHKITKLETNSDRKTLAITVDGLEPKRIYRIMLATDVKTADNLPLFTRNAWYTLNQISDVAPLATIVASINRVDRKSSGAQFERKAGSLRVRMPSDGAYSLRILDLRGAQVAEVTGHGPGERVIKLSTRSPLITILTTATGKFTQVIDPEGP